MTGGEWSRHKKEFKIVNVLLNQGFTVFVFEYAPLVIFFRVKEDAHTSACAQWVVRQRKTPRYFEITMAVMGASLSTKGRK